MKQLSIGFGALLPPIAKQLKDQGFKFDIKEVKRFEKLRESITYLHFSSLISESVRDLATQKLFNKIKEHIEKWQKRKKGFIVKK